MEAQLSESSFSEFSKNFWGLTIPRGHKSVTCCIINYLFDAKNFFQGEQLDNFIEIKKFIFRVETQPYSEYKKI